MILDSSAWVELFQGTVKGKEVKSVLEKEENFTSIASFPEIVQWCLRTGRPDIVPYLSEVKRISQVLALTETIGLAAGKLNYERKKAGKKWGMVDSIIASTAQAYGLKILTTDNGFRDLPDAEVL